MSEILKILSRELGANAVVSGLDIGDKYAVDVSGENPHIPAAVILPRTTEDVAAILKHCSAARQPVVVQGAENLPFRDILSVMDACKVIGAPSVDLVASRVE